MPRMAESKSAALILFPLAARFSQVQMAARAKGARQDGLGALFISGAGTGQFAAAALITLLFAWLLLGIRGILCCMVLCLFTWGLKAWFHRKLGGITGDIIGFASELNEILCLLILTALIK